MIRRDYRPGGGPIRGLVAAVPIAVTLWAIALILVARCALPPGTGDGW